MGHGFTIKPYINIDWGLNGKKKKPIRHTSAEAAGYVIEVDDDTTFAQYTANGNKTNSEVLKMGGAIVAGVGALAAGAVLSSTTTKQTPTPIMIYAKKCYGIEYADFTESKFNTEAEIDLGINDKSKLVKDDERKKNFELFKEKHFSTMKNMQSYSGNEPELGMKAYTEIEKYALSSYGSIMIKKILTQPKTPKFLIGVSNNPDARAFGQSSDNYIVLPVNFPAADYFAISKQKILGVGIIHHEMEHTKHGASANVDLNRNIMEEWKAVRYNENPVRIINGIEPRYVYYSNESKKTINILTKEIKQGQWTYNKTDPSKSMIAVP